MKNFSKNLSDNENLHLTLPYVCSLFEDSEATVVCQAFDCFCFIIKRMSEPFVNMYDTALFKEFIWENILKISKFED